MISHFSSPFNSVNPNLIIGPNASSTFSDSVDIQFESIAKESRKMARRKSRAYRFDSDAPATEKELKELFQSFDKELKCSGTMLPVHLSNIWRLVTGEKGNLFKEMKLFQRYCACKF